jgi:AcrR family transcriptional regulator
VGGRKVPEAQRREQLIAAAYDVAVRDGLDGVTARGVAAEAGASPGLVFFHFGSKEGLLLGLLDTLLAGALDAEVTPQISALPTAVERLLALLRVELEGIPPQRFAVELFFAYWVSLGRTGAFRERIGAALDRYRAVFVPVCAGVAAELRLPVPAETLATMVVSFIQGAAVQAVRDPARYDVDGFLTTVAALLRPAPAPAPPVTIRLA